MSDSTSRLAALSAARWRLAVVLTAAMTVIYVAFILLIAFKPALLGAVIVEGLSLGITGDVSRAIQPVKSELEALNEPAQAKARVRGRRRLVETEIGRHGGLRNRGRCRQRLTVQIGVGVPQRRAAVISTSPNRRQEQGRGQAREAATLPPHTSSGVRVSDRAPIAGDPPWVRRLTPPKVKHGAVPRYRTR